MLLVNIGPENSEIIINQDQITLESKYNIDIQLGPEHSGNK